MPTGLTAIRDLDASAVRYSVSVVGRATPGDLDLPTPCSAWSLGQLLAHMTAQHRGFAAAAAGQGQDSARWQALPTGEDAVFRYADAAAEVLAAFAAVADQDQGFVLPELGARPVRARRAIGFHFIDYVVHGWDVARSLGIAFELDSQVIEAAVPIALAVPGGEVRDGPNAAFAPARTTRPEASAFESILSALGRSPDWPD